MVPPIMNSEAQLCPAQDMPFETKMSNTHESIVKLVWEAALSQQQTRTSARDTTTLYDKALVEYHKRHIENCRPSDEDLIALEVKLAIKEMAKNDLTTMVKKSLENILGTSFPKAQRGIKSVVYNIDVQVTLGVPQGHNCTKNRSLHSNVLDTEEAPKRLLKRLLAFSSSLRLIETFVRDKT